MPSRWYKQPDLAKNATGTYPFRRKHLELKCCPCGIHVPLANTPIVLAQNRHIQFAVAMPLQAQCQYAGQMLDLTLTPELIQAVPQIALVLTQRLTTCVEVLHYRRSAKYHLSQEFCLRHLLDGLHVSRRSRHHACRGVILDAQSQHIVSFGTLWKTRLVTGIVASPLHEHNFVGSGRGIRGSAAGTERLRGAGAERGRLRSVVLLWRGWLLVRQPSYRRRAQSGCCMQ